MPRKPTLVILLLAAIGAGLILWPKLSPLFGAEEPDTDEQPQGRGAVAVTFLEIAPEALSSTVVANGTLRALHEIVVQPETSGRVVELHLRDGALVEKGDLLVRLDARLLQTELEATRAERDLAAKTFQRQEELIARNAVPQESVDTAGSRLTQLEAQLERIRAQIDDTEIRAPFAGQLGLREISVGAYVTPGHSLTTLQAYEKLLLDFSVPERYQGRVHAGSKVELEVRGFDSRFEGEIIAQAPNVSAETRMLRFRAEVANPGRRLLPGNFARVSVPLQNFPEALMVPAMAVLRDEASAYVFLAEEGKAVRKTVTIGIRTRDQVQILEGLKSGDRVIERGGQNLSDGTPIKIVKRPQTLGPASNP